MVTLPACKAGGPELRDGPTEPLISPDVKRYRLPWKQGCLVSDSSAYAWACIPTMLQYKLYRKDRGRLQLEKYIGASTNFLVLSSLRSASTGLSLKNVDKRAPGDTFKLYQRFRKTNFTDDVIQMTLFLFLSQKSFQTSTHNTRFV